MDYNIFKTRYRIKKCSVFIGNYQAEFRIFWMPFFLQCFNGNTSRTIDGAKRTIEYHKEKSVNLTK